MECLAISGAVVGVLQSLETLGKALQTLYTWSTKEDDGNISADDLQLREKVWQLLKELHEVQQDCQQLPTHDQSYLSWSNASISKDLAFLCSQLRKQSRGRPWSCFCASPCLDMYINKVEETLKRSRNFVDHVGSRSQAQSTSSSAYRQQSEYGEILSEIAKGKQLTSKQIKRLCPFFEQRNQVLVLDLGFKEEGDKVYLIEEVSIGKPAERASRRVRLCSLTFWLREVSSPYVAKLERVIETEFCFYLYSDVGDYRPLREWLHGGQEGCSDKLIRTLCRGVIYMHDNRMVHKNINSKNVLVKADGSACLLTGLIETKWMLQESDNVETLEDPEALRWRMIYDSPERIGADSKALYAPACDVYSLGIVMAEIAVHKSFFDQRPSLDSKEQVDQFVHTHLKDPALLELYGKCTHLMGAMRPSVDSILELLDHNIEPPTILY